MEEKSAKINLPSLDELVGDAREDLAPISIRVKQSTKSFFEQYAASGSKSVSGMVGDLADLYVYHCLHPAKPSHHDKPSVKVRQQLTAALQKIENASDETLLARIYNHPSSSLRITDEMDEDLSYPEALKRFTSANGNLAETSDIKIWARERKHNTAIWPIEIGCDDSLAGKDNHAHYDPDGNYHGDCEEHYQDRVITVEPTLWPPFIALIDAYLRAIKRYCPSCIVTFTQTLIQDLAQDLNSMDGKVDFTQVIETLTSYVADMLDD